MRYIKSRVSELKEIKSLGSIVEEVNQIVPKTPVESQLLSVVEKLLQIVLAQKVELQELRDENNRLKGEKGKPDIKPNTKNKDVSSERERKENNTQWKKQSKKEQIQIDEEVPCPINKSRLPKDAIFKGYRKLISQDIDISRHNRVFILEDYYSPQKHKTYSSSLPKEYSGYFGGNLRSLIVSLNAICDVTEGKIVRFLESIGINISKGSLSNILHRELKTLSKERDEILTSAIKSTKYQQTDNTSTREKGKNLYTHVICNEYFTTFYTEEHKKRIGLLKILQINGKKVKCICNRTTMELFRVIKLPGETVDALLRVVEKKKVYSQGTLSKIIDKIKVLKNKDQIKPKIIDAMAIAYYRMQKDHPIVKHLMSDEAGEYGNIVEEQTSCWVHDARNYKKLSPLLKLNRDIYDKFMSKYWRYYRKLLKYKKKPCGDFKISLEKEFDRIFSQKTGYEDLNFRIQKTMAHKKKLLLVLKYPFLPLHNNLSEIALRRIVRKRDISLHTMSRAGTTLRDSVLSIVETAMKLNVSAYQYLSDRIKRTYNMPSLASLIST